MISACLVLMGLATFANATWGNRLPSVLGPSATDTGAMATAGAIFGAPAMWMAGFVGGLFEIVVGVSGVLGTLRRFLPPYVCGIVVLTIGVSLARVAGGWIFATPGRRCSASPPAAVALDPAAHGDRPPAADRRARPRGDPLQPAALRRGDRRRSWALADFAAAGARPLVRPAAALRLRRPGAGLGARGRSGLRRRHRLPRLDRRGDRRLRRHLRRLRRHLPGAAHATAASRSRGSPRRSGLSSARCRSPPTARTPASSPPPASPAAGWSRWRRCSCCSTGSRRSSAPCWC